MSTEWFKDISGGVSDLIKAGAQYEAAKNGTFSAGGNAVMQTTYAPEVDAKNNGAPISYGVPTMQRPLVGDESKTALKIDRKALLIGGGLMVTVALVLAFKK